MKINQQSAQILNQWYSQLSELEQKDPNKGVQLTHVGNKEGSKEIKDKKLDDYKFTNLTDVVDKAKNIEMRKELLRVLTSGLGFDDNDSGLKNIKEQLLGKDPKNEKDEVLTPLEARRIIDSARILKAGYVEEVINTATNHCANITPEVKIILAQTIKKCASHPDVSKLMQDYGAGKRDVSLLSKICNLALTQCSKKLTNLHYVRGYLVGFAGKDKAVEMTADMYTIGTEVAKEVETKTYNKGVKDGDEDHKTQKKQDESGNNNVNPNSTQSATTKEGETTQSNEKIDSTNKKEASNPIPNAENKKIDTDEEKFKGEQLVLKEFVENNKKSEADYQAILNKQLTFKNEKTDEEKLLSYRKYFEKQKKAISAMFYECAQNVHETNKNKDFSKLETEEKKEIKETSLFLRLDRDYRSLKKQAKLDAHLKQGFKQLLMIDWSKCKVEGKKALQSEERQQLKNWLFTRYFANHSLGAQLAFRKDDLNWMVDLIDNLPVNSLRDSILAGLKKKESNPKNTHKQNFEAGQDESMLLCNQLLMAVQDLRKNIKEKNLLNKVSKFTGNTYVKSKANEDPGLKKLSGYTMFASRPQYKKDELLSVRINDKTCQYKLFDGGGQNLNCFFFASLNQIDKQVTNDNAEMLRGMVIKYAQDMVKNPDEYKGYTSTSDGSMYIETSQGWVGADEIGTQINSPDFQTNVKYRSTQTDTTFGAILASLKKRPVVVVGKVNNGTAVQQMFDIDLKTGEKLTGDPIRLHYDGTIVNSTTGTAYGHFQSIHEFKQYGI